MAGQVPLRKEMPDSSAGRPGHSTGPAGGSEKAENRSLWPRIGAMPVTIVTITNRQRWRLLQQTLHAAFDAGAERAVVVDNESQDDIAAGMDRAFPGRHQTIRLNVNQGSAGAYYEGIKAAIEEGAEFILLLDDDNVVQSGTVASLMSTWESLLSRFCANSFCVTCVRLTKKKKTLLEAMEEEVLVPTNAFLKFNITDIPAKAWKHFFHKGRVSDKGWIAPTIPVPRTRFPWGGTFFHRSLIERFGYPDRRFVLYGDDVDFSLRITSAGGSIWLDPHAQLEDIDQFWGARPSKMLFLEPWISLGSDKQVYYSARNLAYFESRHTKQPIVRSLNRAFFFATIWGIAKLRKKGDRFSLIVQAVREGEDGILGLNPTFPSTD